MENKKTTKKRKKLTKKNVDKIGKIASINFSEKKEFFSKDNPIMRNKPVIKIILISILAIFSIAIIFFIFKNKKDNDKKSDKKNELVQNANENYSGPREVIEADSLDEALPENPEVIAQGRFVDVEQDLEGKALFIKNEKEKILRFENFKTINGQDMHVYLSPVLDLDKNDVVDLGLLRATSGQINYKIDDSVDIEKYKNVLIWSNPFDAFFGYASLLTKDLPAEAPEIENISPNEENQESQNTNSEENNQEELDENQQSLENYSEIKPTD